MNMKRSVALAAITVATLWGANCAAAGKGGYVGGSGDAVKSWKPCNFDLVSKPAANDKPILVYIYDHEAKNNPFAKILEGKEALGHSELKDKLAAFEKFKIKCDGKDSKDWPAETLKDAEKGAALIMLSSDRTLKFVFDKSKTTEERSLNSMMAAAVSIHAHDEKHTAAEKAKREEYEKTHPLAPDKGKEKEKEPDLAIKIDPKKPEPKKADAKKAAADAKKAADAAKAGEKVADGKDPKAAGDKTPDGKPAMKKAPQDE